MLPNPDCVECGLAQTRKCIIPSKGETPADVLVVLEAPTDTDEMFGHLLSGPDGKIMTTLLFEAAQRVERKFSVHVVAMTMCRPHLKGVDRPPSKTEILRCTPNVMEVVGAVDPLLTILVGDRPKAFYQKEFPESVTISPPWLLRKHPGLWLNTVQTIADGLRKYLPKGK